MDTLTPQRRSWNMSKIRGQDTAPEMIVRSVLHRLGFRFRLHRRSLPGTPDIVLVRLRTAIFVHGCFWHQHRGCRFAYTPKTNAGFWKAKLDSNVARDRNNVLKLQVLRWRVLTIWECEVKDRDALARRLAGAVLRS